MGNKLWIAVIITLALVFFANWYCYPRPITDITEADSMRIISELKARSAGDCVITDMGSYWRCEEMATNRVFKVKK